MRMSDLMRSLKIYYKNAEKAEKIILNCAMAAAGASAVGGVIPVLEIPAICISCVGAVWTMYIQLCTCLGIPFKENLAKAIASAALSNLATNLIGVFAVELLTAFIPGMGCVAGALITFACVYLAGVMFMNMILAFAKMGTTGSALGGVAPDVFGSFMRNCEISKDDIKAVKNVFKQNYQK